MPPRFFSATSFLYGDFGVFDSYAAPRTATDHDNSIPYWKRAHRDWRLWTAVFFVAAALAIYIVTVDLSLVPRVHTGSVTVGK